MVVSIVSEPSFSSPSELSTTERVFVRPTFRTEVGRTEALPIGPLHRSQQVLPYCRVDLVVRDERQFFLVRKTEELLDSLFYTWFRSRDSLTHSRGRTDLRGSDPRQFLKSLWHVHGLTVRVLPHHRRP